MKKKSKSNSKKKSRQRIRKNYTILFKKIAIKHFGITNSKRDSAKNLKVPRSTLQRWIKQGIFPF